MARRPTQDTTALEARMGPAPITATTANRTMLKAWVRAKGVPSAVADKMKLASLANCYNSASYLEAVIRRHEGEDDTGPASVLAADDTGPAPQLPDPPPVIHLDPAPAPATGDDAAALALLRKLMGGKQELDEARVIELIQAHAPRPETPVYRVEVTTPARVITTGAAPRHHIFADVLKLAAQGINVMLVGPAGSGKTTIAEQVAEALGLPFYFNGAIDTPYKLSGFIDAQGRVVSTAFRRAYEGGGVYLFDEVDASLPGALMAFNAALANGAADFPDGMVERHPDFRCIAAANTFGRGADRVYVGRNQLDGASLDRFFSLAMDYDEQLEAMLVPDEGRDWVRYVQRVRAAVARLQVRHIVSPRASVMGWSALAAGVDRATVEAGVVWKGLDAATITKLRAEV